MKKLPIMAKHIQDTEYAYTCQSIHSLSNIVCMYVHKKKGHMMRNSFPNKNPPEKLMNQLISQTLLLVKTDISPYNFLARHHLDDLDIKKTFLETKRTVLNNACRQLTRLHSTHTHYRGDETFQNYFKSLKTL